MGHMVVRYAALLVSISIDVRFPFILYASRMGVDPTFPLFPALSFLSCTLILLLFTSHLIRRSWNLGIIFLCFWLFWVNLAAGVNAILWADGVELKAEVFCNLGTT